MPCRVGIGNWPTNEAYSGSRIFPATLAPLIGLGLIANDDSLPEPLRRSHAVRERVNKGINPAADVLHVKNESIEAVEHCVSWFARLAVKRMNAQSRLSIHAVTSLDHVVLHVAADSVLRTKQRSEVDPGCSCSRSAA